MEFEITPQDAIDVLNRMLQTDREATLELFNLEVPCNEGIGDDPTIQVGPSYLDDTPLVVRPLGVINGLFGVGEDGFGPIAMYFDREGRLECFMDTWEARRLWEARE